MEGITLSVQRAHISLTPGYLSLAKGLVTDANVNRSPYAYEANPAEERAKYESVGGQVDKEMTILSFKKVDGTPLGFVVPWIKTIAFRSHDLLTQLFGVAYSIGFLSMVHLSTEITHSLPATTKVTRLSSLKKTSETASWLAFPKLMLVILPQILLVQSARIPALNANTKTLPAMVCLSNVEVVGPHFVFLTRNPAA